MSDQLPAIIDRLVDNAFRTLTIQNADDIICSGSGGNITIGRMGSNNTTGSIDGARGPAGPTGPASMLPVTGPTGPTGASPTGPAGQVNLSGFNNSLGTLTYFEIIGGVVFFATP